MHQKNSNISDCDSPTSGGQHSGQIQFLISQTRTWLLHYCGCYRHKLESFLGLQFWDEKKSWEKNSAHRRTVSIITHKGMAFDNPSPRRVRVRRIKQSLVSIIHWVEAMFVSRPGLRVGVVAFRVREEKRMLVMDAAADNSSCKLRQQHPSPLSHPSRTAVTDRWMT